jgi:branched-chain amino acid transport system substrate-binding protein
MAACSVRSSGGRCSLKRRAVLKAGLALGTAYAAGPFPIAARGEEPIRIGLVDPLTGAFAALGRNEQHGAAHAVEEINAKGGILGRPVELLVEDSTTGNIRTAMQQAREVIERHKVSFLLGNVNSAMALALGRVAHELKTLHIVTGGHADSITGHDCHWNLFRVCSTTQMEANAVAGALIKNAGKRWYYLTPDYSFGHALQAGLERAAQKLGGTNVGGDLVPLGTADFLPYLQRAQETNADVIIVLVQGDDAVAALHQAVDLGLDKRVHLAGALLELEVLESLPPDARVGTWVFEWYWKQAGVPHIDRFVADIKAKTGKVPTARTWFGYVAAWTCALAANQEKSLDPVRLAKALQDFKLPPEVALMPNQPFYRAGDHQLIGSVYVGTALKGGSPDDEDLFHVDQVVSARDITPPVADTGCILNWPS